MISLAVIFSRWCFMSRWKRCKVEGCFGIAIWRGLCDAHKSRMLRRGRLDEDVPIRRRLARVVPARLKEMMHDSNTGQRAS
jgi:hypothetical protein